MLGGVRERMDLDLAAAKLAERTAQWISAGLSVSPGLWRRGTDSYPVPDRGRDGSPDRLAVQVAGAGWEVGLFVELEAAGWAHIGFLSESGETWQRKRVVSTDSWAALLDDAVMRATRTCVQHAQLVARTCTTGWLDWIHGDLWVTPTCLVRVRAGLLDTVANSTGPGLAARTPGHTVSYDPAAVRAAHRTNKVIAFDEIAHARLRGGPITYGLAVMMTDGTSHELLWRSSDPARRLLMDRLLPVLGERLVR